MNENSQPDRSEILNVLTSLISKKISRHEASKWAENILSSGRIEVTDLKAWETIKQIGAADLVSTDRPYLYDDCDFIEWERELRKG